VKKSIQYLMGLTLVAAGSGASASCTDVSWIQLKNAMKYAADKETGETGGYGLNMWATFVDETGMVCAVATNGVAGAAAGNSEWLGSRVISAQKANTANAFSLDGYAISTANLYAPVQPGGSLFGLQFSNPVDAGQAYDGSPYSYGTNNDALRGHRVGGVNVFGGGLAVYKGGKKVGAIGVSGDTSCRDHAFAWKMRMKLGMQPGGVGITTANYTATGGTPPASGGTVGDEAIISLSGQFNQASNYWTAWAQPACPNSLNAAGTAAIGPGTLVTGP